MWETELEFVKSNWKTILMATLIVISIVAAIVSGKKKGLSFGEIVLGIMTEQIPGWVTIAEKDGGTGEHKKVQVLNEAVNYVAKKLGRKLTEEETAFVVTKASEFIESVLLTPQKKTLGASESEKKSKYRG